jgi:toxin CcdB
VAQFDVHGLSSGDSLVVDCQSDLLEHLNTRFVVPLIPRARAPKPAHRLNPVFTLDGGDYVMATQFAAAVLRRDLGGKRLSLKDHSLEILGALDVLLTGV